MVDHDSAEGFTSGEHVALDAAYTRFTDALTRLGFTPEAQRCLISTHGLTYTYDDSGLLNVSRVHPAFNR